MAYTTDPIPDLSGRIAVVTGANGGLETAKALAGKGAEVVMAARDQDKAADAAEQIRAAVPGAALHVVPLDLGSLRSVREAAGRIAAVQPRLDILAPAAGRSTLLGSSTWAPPCDGRCCGRGRTGPWRPSGWSPNLRPASR